MLQKNAGVLLFRDRHTVLLCLCPCMLHMHKAHRTGSRAAAGGCSGDQRAFPPCGAQTITIFTPKFNQVAHKSAQSALSWTVCSSPECSAVTLPVSLVPKSADVVSGTVSGEKESSGKWSCFCTAFQAFGLNAAQGAAGKFCSCTTIILEVKEVLENFFF